MKKVMIVVMCVTALFLHFGKTGLAQESERKFGIGARVNYLDISTGAVVGRDPKVDANYLAEVDLSYFFNEDFSLELSAGYAKSDVTMVVPGFSGTVGELTQVPVLLTGRLHFPTGTMATPYVGMGLGYYFNSFDGRSGTPGSTAEFDDSFGYHVNGGIEFLVARNMGISLDAKYVWNQSEFGTSGSKRDVDLDAFAAGLGLTYYF